MKVKTALKCIGLGFAIGAIYTLGKAIGAKEQRSSDIKELHESLKEADKNFYENNGLNLLFGIDKEKPLRIWGVFLRRPGK